MKLNLKKAQLVNLSHDNKVLPNELTPQVGGGIEDVFWTVACPPGSPTRDNFSGVDACAPLPTFMCDTLNDCMGTNYTCRQY